MGGACLRGHGHHWPAGGSGRPPARGRRQSHLADEPDPAGADARPQLLRAARDADAVHDGLAQDEPDAVSYAVSVAHALGVRVRVAVGDRGCERLGDAVPITDCDGNTITFAEWQPKGVELALAVYLSRRPRRRARSSRCEARSARG